MPRVVGRKVESQRRELEKTGLYVPMKAILVNTRIKGYKIPLPSGLNVELSRNNQSFILASKEDEDFVLKHCKGIILQELNHDDFIRWISRDILPHLKVKHSEKEVQKFIWKDEYEDTMIKHLIERGYIVTKEDEIDLNAQLPEEPEDPNQITMDDVLGDDPPAEEITHDLDINLNPDIPKAPEAPEQTEDDKKTTTEDLPTVVFVCSKEEMDSIEKLREIAAKRGYEGDRMRSKKNYIDWIKLSLKENEALPDDN